MITRRHLVALSAASTVAQIPIGHRAFAQPVATQGWPTRVVKLVVPFTPGGGIDGVARIVGARLSEKWVADFAPVTLICLFPNLLVVPNSSPIRSVADLIAEAKKEPGKITFASPGHGSSPHMSGELFKYLAKVDLVHVPYRGASPALTDVLAGRIDAYFSVMASGIPLVRSGQLRALGVTTAARVQGEPDIPTIAEGGVPGYDTSSWFAFFVPAKTPADIIKRMHADTVAVLAEPPIKAKLDGLGLITVGSTPEELGAHFKSEMEKWAPVIKAANIKVSE